MPNTDHSSSTGDAVQEAAADYMRQLREKILFGLSVYKFLNPSMLHVFLGTSTPASLWKEQVLEELIAEGLVQSTTVTLQSVFDRSQSYQILHLPQNEYVPPIQPAPTDPTDTTDTLNSCATRTSSSSINPGPRAAATDSDPVAA